MADKKFEIDYFISRRGTHAAVAQEVAQALKSVGVTSFSQDYDIATGENFVGKIHDALERCEHFIALLTSDYDSAPYTRMEWTSFIPVHVESGEKRRLIVIRLENCQPLGLLRGIVYADLVGVTDPQERRRRIIAATESQSASIPHDDLLFENVPNRDLNFTGRETRLAELHKLLSIRNAPTAITQAAIHGLGGIGKTTLAAEYAHRYASAYSGVWWAPAENPAVLIASLATLAGKLDPQLLQEKDQEQGARAGLSLIAHGSGLPFLLIYDNVESPEAVRDLVPSGGARLLITTRYPDWGGLAAEVKLDVLAPTDATEFLRRRAGRNDTEGAGKLAEALGFLPLALDHAGAYCKTRGTSFQDYGKQLEARLEFVPKGAPYPASVAATFELAIEKATADSKHAETLLGFFAFLAPGRIPLELIGNDIVHVDDRAEAMAALTGVSLAEYAVLDGGAPGVAVHRLVQAAMRRRLDESGQASALVESVTRALDNTLPDGSYGDPSLWPKCSNLLPHVLAIRERDPWRLAPSDHAAELLSKTGAYLLGRALVELAEPLLRESLAIAMRLHGPEDFLVARHLNNLANLLRVKHLYREAESLIRSAQKVFENTVGKETTAYAISLNVLACLFIDTLRHDDAEPLLRQAIEIGKRILGPEAEFVPPWLHNLAQVLVATDRSAEAEPLFREAIQICTKLFGNDHPNTAINERGLASVLLTLGRNTEAVRYAAHALSVHEAYMGPTHPWTINSARIYADIRVALNQPEEAAAVKQTYNVHHEPREP